MQSTEGGRKLNQAVNTTSKAVGGAITHAKGALSNWWSSMTTAQQQIEQKGEGDRRIAESVDEDDLEIVVAAQEQQDVPAEEFLESEVEVARKEVPPVPEKSSRAGDVFTV